MLEDRLRDAVKGEVRRPGLACRYLTDASIYQIEPVGYCATRPISPSRSTWRATKGRDPAHQRGQMLIDFFEDTRNVVGFDTRRGGGLSAGVAPAQCLAEAARPVVPGRCLDVRRNARSR